MGTFSQASIKCDSIDKIIGQLTAYFKIGRKESFNDERWWHFKSIDSLSDTIIVSQNFNNDWVEIKFNFDNLYFYDEYLRRVSRALNTEILLGYYQSTTGDGRIAKFKNGDLELSFYERYYYHNFNDGKTPTIDRIFLADNFGVLNSKMKKLKTAKLNQDSSLIDADFIYEYFKLEGWESNLNKEHQTYLHLEKIIVEQGIS